VCKKSGHVILMKVVKGLGRMRVTEAYSFLTSSPRLAVYGVPWETMLRLHRLMGWGFLIVGGLHGLFWLAAYAHKVREALNGSSGDGWRRIEDLWEWVKGASVGDLELGMGRLGC
jgi:hypothetical protein